MTVTHLLRGYPELVPGTVIWGFKNMTFKIDGLPLTVTFRTAPCHLLARELHLSMYFTRKRWLAAETEVLEQLGNLGIRIPGADYLQRGTRLPSAAEDLEANEDLDSDDERAEIEDDVHEWLDENPESFENVEQ